MQRIEFYSAGDEKPREQWAEMWSSHSLHSLLYSQVLPFYIQGLPSFRNVSSSQILSGKPYVWGVYIFIHFVFG